MQAADIAESIPVVTGATTAAQAIRVVAEYRLQGLVVAGPDGVPTAVIRGSELLGAVLPPYMRDDPRLAHVLDEAGADELCARLTEVTIDDLLARREVAVIEPPSVLPEDTILEVASLMAQGRHQLILCRDRDGTFVGTVMLSRVFAILARRAGEDSPLVERRLSRDLVDPDAARGAGTDVAPASGS